MPCPVELGFTFQAKNPGELSLMRCEHWNGCFRCPYRLEQNAGVLSEDGEGVGVEHQALFGIEGAEYVVTALPCHAGPGPDENGSAARIGQALAESIRCGDRLNEHISQRRVIDR